MGEVKGFMTHARQEFDKEPVATRVKHYKEFIAILPEEKLAEQGARCMDCGVPFCHAWCPVSNVIPDWNDLVYRGLWQEALKRLNKTNNFPEITGRICPAPCENSCVLGYNYPAVTIRNLELAIIEKGFAEGWMKPRPPKHRSHFKVAVIGSGPSGLAAADQLNKAGHHVTVFEKNETCGGLMRWGIPDFKLEKAIVERRLDLMEKEGIKFKTGVCVGQDSAAVDVVKKYDAVVLAGGAEEPRDLPVPGRNLRGVYFAMEYLTQQNRLNAGSAVMDRERINAHGKHVVVLGGGDTGSDCVGTANRQGALSVKQFELLAQPPKERYADNPWPQWANILRTSTSHQEGVERDYCITTKVFLGEGGVLKKLSCGRVEFGAKDPLTGRQPMKEIAGSGFEVACDLVFLAMGFLGPRKKGMIDELGLNLDDRGNVKTGADYMSSQEGIFVAGDMRTGQSLVVRAINEGRRCADSVDKWLAARKKT